MNSIIMAHPRAPWHLRTIGWIMLAWSALAGADHLMSFAMGEDYLRASGMSAGQVHYFSTLPLWVNLSWTVSVWGALLASVALLLRHQASIHLFGLSAAATALYILHTWFLSEGIAAMGAMWFMPGVIGLITLALVGYTTRLARCGLLR